MTMTPSGSRGGRSGHTRQHDEKIWVVTTIKNDTPIHHVTEHKKGGLGQLAATAISDQLAAGRLLYEG
jgi:hypothetical protein